jgi:hypothetical protein
LSGIQGQGPDGSTSAAIKSLPNGDSTAELKATEDYQRHNHQDEQGFHRCLAFLIFPKTRFQH